MTKWSSLIGWVAEAPRNDPQNRVRVRVRVRSHFRYKLQALFLLSGAKNRRYLLLTGMTKREVITTFNMKKAR